MSMGHQEFFRLFPAKCELKRAGFDVNLGLDLHIEMGVWPTRECCAANHVRYRGNLPIRNREFLIWAKGKGGISPSRAAIFKKCKAV